jgi:triacylglycerol lipase
LRGGLANWKPDWLETLSNYSHLEAEYLIENDYSCRQLDEPDISKIWQWVQFSRILLPQLRVKTQGDEEKSGIKGRLRQLVQTLIQASLQQPRAIKYVERLNYSNQLP